MRAAQHAPREPEWLSCTIGPATPASAYLRYLERLQEEAAVVLENARLDKTTSGIAVGVTSCALPLRRRGPGAAGAQSGGRSRTSSLATASESSVPASVQ